MKTFWYFRVILIYIVRHSPKPDQLGSTGMRNVSCATSQKIVKLHQFTFTVSHYNCRPLSSRNTQLNNLTLNCVQKKSGCSKLASHTLKGNPLQNLYCSISKSGIAETVDVSKKRMQPRLMTYC